MEKSKILASLVRTFLKIGVFTFGGGYAMIALMDTECVEKKHWITHDELMDMMVVAESTPGPISLNCATYIGYQQAGYAGAVLATISLVVPSFIILFLISVFFENILEITVIANAFKGIKSAVGVIIFHVALKMFISMKKEILPVAIAICSFAALLIFNLLQLRFSTIYMIMLSGLAGYLAMLFGQWKSGKGGGGR